MSLVVKILVVVVVIYLIATYLLWQLQDNLIFKPQSIPLTAINQYADLAIDMVADDGVVLRGWLNPGEETTLLADSSLCQLLIYFGGNAEEVSHHLENRRFPFPQLYINYRGYGQSDGAPAAQDMRKDALLLYDKIQQQLAISPERICLLGRSLGTHLATYIAAHRQVGRLVLVSPYDSITNIGMARYPIFPVRQLLRHHFDTVAEAALVQAPTLVLLAQEDQVIPHVHSHRLLRHWQAPWSIQTIAGTTHNDMDVADYWSSINHFLQPESLNTDQ